MRPSKEGGEILHASESYSPLNRLLYSVWLVLLEFAFLWLLMSLNIRGGGISLNIGGVIRLEPFCEYC